MATVFIVFCAEIMVCSLLGAAVGQGELAVLWTISVAAGLFVRRGRRPRLS